MREDVNVRERESVVPTKNKQYTRLVERYIQCHKHETSMRGLWSKSILMVLKVFLDFLLLVNVIQQCFICRLSDSTVSEDAVIEPIGGSFRRTL